MASLTLIFMRAVGTLQPMRPLGLVGSKFNWPSEDQCRRSQSKWVFVLIPHLKINSANWFSQNCLEGRRSVLDDGHDCSLFWCALSGLRDWTLCDWSRAWPTLTWLAKLVGVSMSSSIQNTNFPHTLTPWTHGQVWGNVLQVVHPTVAMTGPSGVCCFILQHVYPVTVVTTLSGGHFKNTFELLNLRALKVSHMYENCIFQCMGKIFCVEFQRYPLKFHTKYLTHTLKDVDFIHWWKFKSS